MKRKAFLKAALAVSATIAIPSTYNYFFRRKDRKDPLFIPYVLGGFCNESEIRKIGNNYMALVPTENNREKLTQLILSDDSNKKDELLNNSEIDILLTKKIQKEFSEYKTVVVGGWVISTTEARQCALFSLIRK